ncbi:ly6/PLAUR domain-containing protein 1 isoform X2 [Pteropus alecto]|uniref:ly6/PLAUR domain-containing protein 1 isoform X2 n=1 Tax=Pteropus alecto TaxID=9402 RepID=UPI000768829A|nr:ly6/PLAUR domain-containing protein 1 isoform X2 [Pteropus alecto]
MLVSEATALSGLYTPPFNFRGERPGLALQIQCYQCEEFQLNNDCSSPEFIVNCTVNVQDMCQKEVMEQSAGVIATPEHHSQLLVLPVGPQWTDGSASAWMCSAELGTFCFGGFGFFFFFGLLKCGLLAFLFGSCGHLQFKQRGLV